jgi:hypothetical protein
MSDNFSSLAKNKDFQKSNVADVYITSGSWYGHRACAFLNQTDRKRYILDPYPTAMHQTRTPVLLDTYKKDTQRGIVHAKFYQSPYAVV